MTDDPIGTRNPLISARTGVGEGIGVGVGVAASSIAGSNIPAARGIIFLIISFLQK